MARLSHLALRAGALVVVALVTAACNEAESGAPADPRAAACMASCDPGHADAFADCVYEFSPAAATVEAGAYNHAALPEVVLDAPGGSLDVVSLGCGGSIVLGFEGEGIVDGPGPDFIVFENPFGPEFPEPAQVEVSEDGCSWTPFPCDPVTTVGCAGVALVEGLPGSEIDPLDPARAGGDAFDLANIGEEQVHFIRIVDRSAAYWAASSQDFCDPGQAGKGGFDLDAVAVLHGG